MSKRIIHLTMAYYIAPVCGATIGPRVKMTGYYENCTCITCLEATIAEAVRRREDDERLISQARFRIEDINDKEKS